MIWVKDRIKIMCASGFVVVCPIRREYSRIRGFPCLPSYRGYKLPEEQTRLDTRPKCNLKRNETNVHREKMLKR